MTTQALHRSKFNLVEVAPNLPDPALPGANWADTFELTTERAYQDVRSLADTAFGSMPSWVMPLLKLRNVIVAPFGLKRDGSEDAPQAENRVGFFPILKESEDRIVLGFNDRHLDFRILVERTDGEVHNRFRVTTLVERHNLLGKLYIAVITPFHKAIVKAALRQAA